MDEAKASREKRKRKEKKDKKQERLWVQVSNK